MDPLHQEMLVRGLDAVGMSLMHAQDIRDFEAQHAATHPWLMPPSNP
jgi:3-isopropylmalate/(R)-2-methylmalate dehydratase small subunit